MGSWVFSFKLYNKYKESDAPPLGGAFLEKYDIRDDNDMFRVAATVAQSYAVQYI